QTHQTTTHIPTNFTKHNLHNNLHHNNHNQHHTHPKNPSYQITSPFIKKNKKHNLNNTIKFQNHPNINKNQQYTTKKPSPKNKTSHHDSHQSNSSTPTTQPFIK
ncbi:MAG: hypothetical protein O7C59_02035, partial [Rickettsia endosymbiont of Ixodes persulcatus]|nr:hypothetical protein [Rickettsia endosymbiont of Ixodes persulcatus]